ncbi:TPA: HNH endonuclease [Vibrio alginolyticus]
MFKVERTGDAPVCLTSNEYNTPEVVERLYDMFHGKCYLCEQADLDAPEIEHFEPHMGDDTLKYDWENLYYSCARCNSIKGTRHRNLIDCCSSEINVVRAIKRKPPTMPDSNMEITAVIEDPRVHNTVELLERCFNEDNTALRGITRANLSENLFRHYTKLLSHRLVIVNRESTDRDIQDAVERIEIMLRDTYEFSAFWRWCVMEDRQLREKLGHALHF